MEPMESVDPIEIEIAGAVGAEQADGDPAQYKDRWLRAAAAFENLRKRSARDLAEGRRLDRAAILREFIPAVDNFERALDSADRENNPWFEGIEAIYLQLIESLKRQGARRFESLGEAFDPTRHEAVATHDHPREPEGTIVDVTQVGYEMEDGTVLRPAKVIVVQRARS